MEATTKTVIIDGKEHTVTVLPYIPPIERLYSVSANCSYSKQHRGGSVNRQPEDELRQVRKTNPALLFCRRQLDTAIDDAKETDSVTGEPTDEAMLDRLWLERKPDHKDPEDFYGSFEWCCHWLSLDPEKERKDAIEEIENSLARRLLAVKRAEWNKRKDDVLYQALATQEQAAARMAQLAAVKRAQLVMQF
jgi:hypothetical protein